HCAERGGEPALMLAGQDDGADHSDGIERVGQRHQRRVEQRRDPANHLEPDEGRQHDYVQAGDQIRRHSFLLLRSAAYVLLCNVNAGNPKNSRTRAFTTSPSCVTSVSRKISSSGSGWNLPSRNKCSRNAVMLRAYIWLAW